jgi:hypothetical protein
VSADAIRFGEAAAPVAAGAMRFDKAVSTTWRRMTPCERCTSAGADTTRRRHRRPGRATCWCCRQWT